jgi:hypothetical protein
MGKEEGLTRKNVARLRGNHHFTRVTPSASLCLQLDVLGMSTPCFRRSWRGFYFLAIGSILTFLYIQSKSTATPQNASLTSKTPSTAVVVAAFSKDDVNWIDFPGWDVWKYEVDNPTAKHSTPKNKGHEATVYLT